ncbi:hypothetical protein V7S43_004131 [Phytophthora oleae]|uniref:EGF-like domain-containing protein n=1 Tax=Phytophthora oleae TaxID=2107226 RepID=A0ABD3FZ76_9STRA
MVKCFFLVLTLLTASAFGLTPKDMDGITTPPSGCELCASSGDCSLAFRGGPGQYCGTWMDRSSHELPCCCPLNAVCNVSPANYVCTCAYVGAMPPYHSESDLMNKVLWLWWVLGILVVVMLSGACIYFLVKQLASQNDESCVYTLPHMIAPVVSPTREALYGSTGHTPAVTVESGVAGLDVIEDEVKIPGVSASHPTPPDDLDVGGDGFDGGLGMLGVVGEVEGTQDSGDEEDIALLTVSAK